MSKVQCRFKGIGVKNKRYSPGDVVLAPWLAKNSLLSPEYKKDWQDRPPMLICLPNGRVWSPDLCSAEDVSGWTVTGDMQCLSVSPTVVCIEETNEGKTYSCYRIKGGFIYEEEVTEAFIAAHSRR